MIINWCICEGMEGQESIFHLEESNRPFDIIKLFFFPLTPFFYTDFGPSIFCSYQYKSSHSPTNKVTFARLHSSSQEEWNIKLNIFSDGFLHMLWFFLKKHLLLIITMIWEKMAKNAKHFTAAYSFSSCLPRNAEKQKQCVSLNQRYWKTINSVFFLLNSASARCSGQVFPSVRLFI